MMLLMLSRSSSSRLEFVAEQTEFFVFSVTLNSWTKVLSTENTHQYVNASMDIAKSVSFINNVGKRFWMSFELVRSLECCENSSFCPLTQIGFCFFASCWGGPRMSLMISNHEYEFFEKNWTSIGGEEATQRSWRLYENQFQNSAHNFTSYLSFEF